MKTMFKHTIFKTLETIEYTKEHLKLGKKTFNEQHMELPPQLASWMQTYLACKKPIVSFAYTDHQTGETHHFYGNQTFKTASTVKVAVMMAMLKETEKQSRWLTEDETKKIENMIIHSNNEDTTFLWNFLGKDEGMQHFFQGLGMKDTQAGKNGYWGLTETTALDQIILLNHLLVSSTIFTKEQQLYARTLMKRVDVTQKWGVSKGSDNVLLKNGWAPARWNDWRIHSIGCIDDRYTLAVYTQGSPTQKYGISLIETLSAQIRQSLTKVK